LWGEQRKPSFGIYEKGSRQTGHFSFVRMLPCIFFSSICWMARRYLRSSAVVKDVIPGFIRLFLSFGIRTLNSGSRMPKNALIWISIRAKKISRVPKYPSGGQSLNPQGFFRARSGSRKIFEGCPVHLFAGSVDWVVHPQAIRVKCAGCRGKHFDLFGAIPNTLQAKAPNCLPQNCFAWSFHGSPLRSALLIFDGLPLGAEAPRGPD
jgi:hypothetical protein